MRDEALKGTQVSEGVETVFCNESGTRVNVVG
jgi:hypothetical protein